jgi:hypothetical protein
MTKSRVAAKHCYQHWVSDAVARYNLPTMRGGPEGFNRSSIGQSVPCTSVPQHLKSHGKGALAKSILR